MNINDSINQSILFIYYSNVCLLFEKRASERNECLAIDKKWNQIENMNRTWNNCCSNDIPPTLEI